MIAKITLGMISGSKALVVSAMFSLQDCAWAGILLVRPKITGKPASGKHPFGLGKVEFIVAACMSVLVLVGVAVLFGTIAHSLLEHRQRAPGILAIWVALVSAIICFAMSRRSRHAARQSDSPDLRAQADFSRADACASVVVIKAVILAALGFELADSLVAVAEAAYVVWYAGGMLYGAVKGLLDASVGPETLAQIRAAARETDGVFEIRSIRAVQSGPEVLATLVVDLPDAMTVAEADRLRERIIAMLRRRFDDIGQVLVGFRTRDAHRRAHRITQKGAAVNTCAIAENVES